MKWLDDILEKISSKERRRAERQPSPELAAHYWNGASPAEHSIRDISATGLFVLTEERWYPGTLLILTLQKKEEPQDGSERAIAVQSKAVRWGSDGVGLEFITPDSRDPRRGQSILSEGADRKSLEKFLVGFRADSGFVVIKYIVPPSEPSLGPSTAWS